jgi:hypothetical protein
MFVLRAKAKLRDATDEAATAAVLGLAGAKAEAALRRHVGALPDAPYAKVDGAFGTVIRLADAFGAPRYLWLTSPRPPSPPCRSCATRWRWAATRPGAWPRSTPACRR